MLYHSSRSATHSAKSRQPWHYQIFKRNCRARNPNFRPKSWFSVCVLRGHQFGHFGPLSEVQGPLRGRGGRGRGQSQGCLLLGAPPLPLEVTPAAARGRLRPLLARFGAVGLGRELQDVVGRGHGCQVGAPVPDGMENQNFSEYLPIT